jgi:hypothetical protein
VVDVREACGQCGGELEEGVCPYCGPKRDDLDGLRIHQISTLRRALIRSRTYALVGGILFMAAGVKLGLWAMRNGGLRALGYALSAGFAAAGAWILFRKSIALDREARKSSLGTPGTPPDFSKLSDGREAWKRLDEIE